MIRRALGAAGRHPAAVTAAGLAGLVFVLFHPAVLGRGVFFQRDIAAYFYPYIEAAVRLVAGGGWPTWNPWVSFGRPLLADPAMQLVYPLTWLNLILPPGVYYTVFVVVHCWATGFGAYLWARQASLSPASAALAGALWCASGPLLSAVNLFHHFAGAAWIPWVLLALARALDKPGAASALLLGAAAGGQALAGSADMCLMTALAALVQAAAFVWARDGSRRRAIVAVAGVAVAGAAYAVLLAAAQWLPAIAQLRGGSRSAQNLATTSFWSVHPASLADLFVPRLLADLTLSPQVRAMLFDGRAPFLLSLYLGAASLPLVALGLLARRRPLPLAATWGISFAVFVLLALGRHAPLHPLIAAAPPFAWLRYPVKFILPAALFWAMLAGLGLDRARQPWAERDRRQSRAALLMALAAALLAVGLAAAQVPPSLIAGSSGKLAASAALMIATGALIVWRSGRERAPSWLTAAVLLVVVADVARVGRHVNALAPPALLRYRPPLAQALAAAGPDARLYVRQESTDELNRLLVRGPGGWDSEAGWALGAQQMLMPPIGARWAISSSYDGDFTGMAPAALSSLSALLPTVDSPLSLKLLRLAAVTHVASLRPRPFDGLVEVGAWESVYAVPVRLFRVPAPLPRVYAVHGARWMSDTAALTALADPSFDPAREVLLPAATGPQASRAATNVEAAAASAGSVRILRRRPNALTVETELADPGWLVAVEGYDAGWTARVDGAAAPVLRANLLFQAVPVPAGRHRVELGYRPPLLAWSGALSAVALAGGLAAAVRRRRADKN